jgi:hypothetical protein
MNPRACWCLVLMWLLPTAELTGAVPPLLAQALEQWKAGHGDIACTQHTRVLDDRGRVKTSRVERYDPSLPDAQRWRLLEIDGKPPTEQQRKEWETRKNRKPRKKGGAEPEQYLEFEHAVAVEMTDRIARYEVNLRPETARLINVEKLSILITVDRETGALLHISAMLREPIRVLLGLAKITDVDLNVSFEAADADGPPAANEVQIGSSARVRLSKFGDPTEYRWSDFKRVTAYAEGRTKPRP